ncbi:MAG: hypothetical protein KTR31_26895 [Myxococcales bacterium]|nr:hypothetical protein [Myxococcales bacterium]
MHDGEAVLPLRLQALTHGPHVLRVIGSADECVGHPPHSIRYDGSPMLALP